MGTHGDGDRRCHGMLGFDRTNEQSGTPVLPRHLVGRILLDGIGGHAGVARRKGTRADSRRRLGLMRFILAEWK